MIENNNIMMIHVSIWLYQQRWWLGAALCLRYINDLRGLAFGKLNNCVNQGNISLGNEKRQCSSIFIEFFVISPYSVVFNEFNPAETSSQSYGNFIGNLNQLDPSPVMSFMGFTNQQTFTTTIWPMIFMVLL